MLPFIRSFFVVGIYSSITVKEQKRQMQQLLNFISTLYVEALYLKKSMNEIEHITANSYSLYEQLKKINPLLVLKRFQLLKKFMKSKKMNKEFMQAYQKFKNGTIRCLFHLQFASICKRSE